MSNSDSSVTRVSSSFSLGYRFAGRFEVCEPIQADPISTIYSVRDLEASAEARHGEPNSTAGEVEKPLRLLRVLRPEIFSARSRELAAEKLDAVVGAGGAHLSPLLFVGIEQKNHLFVVYDRPAGEPLDALIVNLGLDRKSAIPTQELLSLCTQVEAALHALPPPWRHGDLRPAQIWVHEGRVTVSGAFLFAALPMSLWRGFERQGRFFTRFPPEFWQGRADDSADRYAVACLVARSMTGFWPGERPSSLADLPSSFAALIERYLHAEPSKRPLSLAPLLEELAAIGGIDVPTFLPKPFKERRKKRDGNRSDDTDASISMRHQNRTRTISEPAPTPVSSDGKTVVRAPDGDLTVPRARLEDLAREAGVDEHLIPEGDAAERGAVELGAVELGAMTNTSGPAVVDGEDSSDELDPRFVRAALGVSIAEDTGENPVPTSIARNASGRSGAVSGVPRPLIPGPSSLPAPVPVPSEPAPVPVPSERAPSFSIDPNEPAVAAAESTQRVGLDELEFLENSSPGEQNISDGHSMPPLTTIPPLKLDPPTLLNQPLSEEPTAPAKMQSLRPAAPALGELPRDLDGEATAPARSSLIPGAPRPEQESTSVIVDDALATETSSRGERDRETARLERPSSKGINAGTARRKRHTPVLEEDLKTSTTITAPRGGRDRWIVLTGAMIAIAVIAAAVIFVYLRQQAASAEHERSIDQQIEKVQRKE